MKIAVNTRFLLPGKIEGIGKVTNEILKRLVDIMPDASFDFLFDRKFDPEFIYRDNVHPRVIHPQTRHPLLLQTWLQIGIKQYLRTSKPDLFLSFDGFMPLGASVPSIITIHDLAYAHFPDQNRFADRWYYKKFMPRFSQEAAHIVTVSNYSKEDISTRLKVNPKNITTIYNGVSEEFHPVSYEAQELCKKRYTEGAPYFLFVGSIHPRKNVDGLIRAFSSFKKINGSKTKLLITGKKGWLTKSVDEAFRSSPFKKDIHFTGYLPQNELPELIGSATALVYVSFFEGFGLPIIEAMACGIPVICSNRNAMAEIADDCALLVDPEQADRIAKAMHRIEIDDRVVQKLKSKGLNRAKSFHWDLAAEQYSEVIHKILLSY